VPTFIELMWAVTGLLLTIGSTFLQPAILLPPGLGAGSAVIQPIGATMQIGAVLLTGCLGGRNAGLLSQVAYIFLGLSGFNVFYHGGGIESLRSPAFGYLLGFIPGSWLCGSIAFARPLSLGRMAISCLCGLAAIHFVGIIYVLVMGMPNFALILQYLWQYSVQLLPGQLVVICGTATLATLLRRLLFY
jgi:biotin transport system substrate-specific component